MQHKKNLQLLSPDFDQRLAGILKIIWVKFILKFNNEKLNKINSKCRCSPKGYAVGDMADSPTAVMILKNSDNQKNMSGS